jgi:predicted small secreted protein
MKKLNILILVVALIFTTLLTGCGNMSMGIGNFTFTKVHIDTHEFSGCVSIEKWYDNERGIEVKTKDFGAMYLSEGSYILIEHKCPICNG